MLNKRYDGMDGHIRDIQNNTSTLIQQMEQNVSDQISDLEDELSDIAVAIDPGTSTPSLTEPPLGLASDIANIGDGTVANSIKTIDNKLESSLNGVKFGINSSGEYGYINSLNQIVPFKLGEIEQLVISVWGTNAANISCTYLNIGSNTTSPNGTATYWTTAAKDNYISFSTAKKELTLVAFICMQGSKSYTVTPSITTGGTGTILYEYPDIGACGRAWKINIKNISGTVRINIYTSYSAIGCIGYMILK